MFRVATMAAIAAVSIAAVPAHSEESKSCKVIKDELALITGVPSLVCASTTALTLARLVAQSATPRTAATVTQMATAQPPQPRTSPSAFGKTASTVDLAPEEGPGLRGYRPLSYNPFEDKNSTLAERANYLYPSGGQQNLEWQAAHSR
jgi:hypothetical protein